MVQDKRTKRGRAVVRPLFVYMDSKRLSEGESGSLYHNLPVVIDVNARSGRLSVQPEATDGITCFCAAYKG